MSYNTSYYVARTDLTQVDQILLYICQQMHNLYCKNLFQSVTDHHQGPMSMSISVITSGYDNLM
jgi:hypothetical protein